MTGIPGSCAGCHTGNGEKLSSSQQRQVRRLRPSNRLLLKGAQYMQYCTCLAPLVLFIPDFLQTLSGWKGRDGTNAGLGVKLRYCSRQWSLARAIDRMLIRLPFFLPFVQPRRGVESNRALSSLPRRERQGRLG